MASVAAIAELGAAVILLTGCAQPAAPVTGPDGAASTGTPQIGAPAAGSGPGVVGAGSFPRSFLIPGTDTSIRLGG